MLEPLESGDKKLSQPSNQTDNSLRQTDNSKKADLIFQALPPQAILCEQDTAAAYCDRCKKFRYTHCYHCDRPICATCSSLMQLRPIKPQQVESKRKPKIKIPKPPKVKTSKRPAKSRVFNPTLSTIQVWILANSYQLLGFSYWWYWVALKLGLPKIKESIKESLLSQISLALIFGPKRSDQLVQEFGVKYRYQITSVAKELVAAGKIVSTLDGGYHPYCWYALPQHADRFPSLVTYGVKDRIKQVLAKCNRPLSSRQISEQIPEFNLNWIHRAVWQMVRDRQLIGKQYGTVRRYVLPEQREVLEKTNPPITQAILDLLQESPGLWQSAIAKKIPYPERTVAAQIKRLREQGVILARSIPDDRRTFLYVNTSANHE